MDIPLQKSLTAPFVATQRLQVGAVEKITAVQMQSKTPSQPSQPHDFGAVEAVNASRISAQNPQIPAIMATERVLKPYGVSMLPSNETSEKLAQHKA